MDQQTLEQLQQQQRAMESASRVGAGVGIVYLVLIVFLIVAGWRLFTKAGQPGWTVLIPLYNIVVVLKIVGRPLWWFFLMIVPIVSFIIALVLALDLAKSFGKSAGFGIGVFFLGFIFVPILAFGSATYVGPAVDGNPGARAAA